MNEIMQFLEVTFTPLVFVFTVAWRACLSWDSRQKWTR
jgi:hypothetical protein